MSEQSKKAKISILEKDNGFEVGMSGDLGHLAAGLAVGIEHIARSSQNFEIVMQMIREIHEKMAEEGVMSKKIVDDAGMIHMHWETGSSLGLAPGEDSFHKM